MSRHKRTFRLRFGRAAALRDEVDEEVRAHLEMRTAELVASGLELDEARREAERRFGDVEAAMQDLYASARRRERRLHGGRIVDDVVRDLGLAVRRTLKSPGYSAVSIGILALAIALTTTTFAVVDHVLVRPLPYDDADRLVSLQSMGEARQPFVQVSMENWVDWRERSTSLAATGLYDVERISVLLGTQAFRADGAEVSGDFFLVFRPEMAAGRAFTSDEGQEERTLAVVSSTFAAGHFGDPDAALGARLSVEGREHEIIGIVPDGQAFPEGTEVWTPLRFRPGSGGMRNNISFQAVGRLAAGVEIERAGAELSAIATGIMEREPEAIYSYGVGVLPLRDVVVGGVVDALWMLMAAVAAVLLVACANLAGLGLARARRRRAEIDVRMALGSGRGRIVRQIMTEYLVLGLIGGMTAIVLTWLTGEILFDRLRIVVPRGGAVALDYRVAGFAFAVSLISGLGAGLVPALRSTRMRGSIRPTRGGITGGRGLPGGVLVAGEIALALSLLVGGGLLLRSFQAVVGRDLGYDPTGVVTAEISLTTADYEDPERVLSYWRSLLDAIQSRPGVAAAAAGNWIPTGGGGTSFLEFPENPTPDYGGGYRVVSERYFEAMGIPLLEGRAFDPRDAQGSERVTIVNQTLAERAWPGESPIGKRVRPYSMEGWMYGGNPPWLTVVGVVGDIRHSGYETDPDTELFVLYRQVPMWAATMTVVARPEAGDGQPLTQLVRDEAFALDPALAVDVGMLDQRVGDLLRERALTMRILVAFACTALLLMCLGMYGLVSYAAAQRTREMAIRAALGARRSGLVGLMLGGAARVIGYGTLAGLVVAYGITGLLESLLVDVPSTDPFTYGGAAAVLAAVALLAALIPSVRAARLDPIEALRAD